MSSFSSYPPRKATSRQGEGSLCAKETSRQWKRGKRCVQSPGVGLLIKTLEGKCGGKECHAKCLLRTRKSGMEARGSVPNLPRLGLQAVPPPPQQQAGLGGTLLGHNIDKAPGRGLLRSAGGQVSPSTPPQGTHLPKPAGWEWKVGRAKTKVTARNNSSQVLQQVQHWQAGFPRGRGIFNFFPSKVLRKSASATGQLSLEP